MYTANDIAKGFEEIAPMRLGISGDELGFVYGDPETQVTGLACLWNIHKQSLQICIDNNVNMIICHESIWLPMQISDWYKGPGEQDVYSNSARKKLLDQYNIAVYRSHSNWDSLEKDGVADQAVTALGIEKLQTVAKQKYFSIQQLPQEISVEDLSHYVEDGIDYHSCRIFGDSKKRIRKFAFLIGGFGENQWHMPQAAMEMGAEAVILGEMSEFIVIACLEMGLPVIESLHSASEIPAIKRQAEMLSKKFTDLPVHYVPSGAMSFL